MSSNPPAATSPSTQPTSPPPQGNAVRLIVLLGLLVVAIGALAFDYAIAKPTNDAADEKIHKHVKQWKNQYDTAFKL